MEIIEDVDIEFEKRVDLSLHALQMRLASKIDEDCRNSDTTETDLCGRVSTVEQELQAVHRMLSKVRLFEKFVDG